MIFDQNRGSERSWTNIDPVGVTILLPSEDFVLLNHSTFKPFECYSDRLLVLHGNGRNFDLSSTDQARNLHGGSRWFRVWHELLIDIVHLRNIV